MDFGAANTEETTDASQPPPLKPLNEPSDGVPEVISTPEALEAYAQKLSQAEGPIAIDAERASGFRYSQRAYLVQIRRKGAGTGLIDPIALPDLSLINEAASDGVWILHAANQDLPCLAELHLLPPRLFDTELAARLLGYPRVGLASVVAALMNMELAKEHSASDWSKRPLPDDWLNYAALDVEVLIDIYEIMVDQLKDAGKLEWAEEEFEAIRTQPPSPPRKNPWMRTSGIHHVRDPRGLAIVRALWEERDRVAQRRDVTPSRIIHDKGLIAAAKSKPRSSRELSQLPVFSGPKLRHSAPRWFSVIERAYQLPEEELPHASRKLEGPPHPRHWKDRSPDASERLDTAKQVAKSRAEELGVPTENLMQPSALRRFCWEPPAVCYEAPESEEAFAEGKAFLAALGVRDWQINELLPLVLHSWSVLPANSVTDE